MYGECNNPECLISLPQLASYKHILFQIPFSFLSTPSCCSPVNVCLGPAGRFLWGWLWFGFVASLQVDVHQGRPGASLESHSVSVGLWVCLEHGCSILH